jgi:hypothetical protein
MPAAPSETRQGAEGQGIVYDARRALHYHERVMHLLRAKANAEQIYLAQEDEVPLLSKDGIQTFCVAPTQPILDWAELDKFRHRIFTGSGILPDWSTRALAYHKGRNGLFAEEMIFANVPGLKLYDRPWWWRLDSKGKVVTDRIGPGDGRTYDRLEPEQFKKAAQAALDRLVEEAGKPAEELVRQTKVLVYPMAELAEFEADYIRGIIEGRYAWGIPWGLPELEHRLTEKQVRQLREDPQAFFRLYEGEKQRSANNASFHAQMRAIDEGRIQRF